jgi:hypothetical protein
MTIEQFAEENRLKTSRDECGDVIIRGKRGHLYVDAGTLCAMWTDAPPIYPPQLKELGGTRWQGDISRGATGRRMQDAWVRGIKPEAYGLAIRLVGARAKRIMSPAQRAVLERATMASLPFRFSAAQKGVTLGLECIDEGQVDSSLGVSPSDGF